jgi:hypothetical protein
MSQDLRKPLPFYGTYALFERAMTYWKQNGIPKRFTSPALKNAVGTEASRIVSGFTGLGWIDEDGIPSDDLKRLIRSYKEDSWNDTLRSVLESTYTFIPNDWSDLTSSSLRDAFRNFVGREVGTLSGSETFFLTAAAEAGIELPDSFMNRTSRTKPKKDHLIGELFSPEPPFKSPIRPLNGNGTASSVSDRDQVDVLLALFDEGALNEKEKAALLTLLFHLRKYGHTGGKTT